MIFYCLVLIFYFYILMFLFGFLEYLVGAVIGLPCHHQDSQGVILLAFE